MKVNETLKLRTAGIYSAPGDPGELLPVVFGDFLSSDAISSDDEAGGMLPAVLIDVLTWTYLLSDSRCATDAPKVYVEDVLQNPIVYTYNPTNDFQGKGVVTTITFNTDPGGRRVSWRGKGTLNTVIALITNPIEALIEMFTEHGNWLISDFDPSTVPEAERHADLHGYTIHWVFREDRTYKEWLTDISAHYFWDVLLTVDGTLAIIPDDIIGVDPSRIMAHLDARFDIDGEAPEGAIEWDLDRQNVVNELTVFHQYSWARDAYTRQDVQTDARSKAFYGTRLPREIRLPGIRTAQHLNTWISLFFARYALLPAIVRVPVRTTRYLALMPSNYLSLTWRWGPEATGAGWQDRLLKVLNTGLDYEGHRMVLECLDTGLDFKQPTYAVLQDTNGTTWYLSVGPDGLFQLQLVNPGQLAINRTTWRWIRLISATSVTYYVSPGEETAVLGTWILGEHVLGGSASPWIIATSQPSGTGTTEPVILNDRAGQTWRLAVSDAPNPTVFFTVEPRRLPFGGYSWQTEVFGRFRLNVNALA